MKRLLPGLAAIALMSGTIEACTNGVDPNSLPARTYRLGFSSTPPRLTIQSVLQTIDAWRPHSDIAQITQSVPWRALLADTSAALLVTRDQKDLAALYRSRPGPKHRRAIRAATLS
jgi:hypothetical protein